jgi:hypothetical protein
LLPWAWKQISEWLPATATRSAGSVLLPITLALLAVLPASF